ncbi:MAG: hypothetical protein NVSMB55_27530 [Mycobacteriales bacterium]
MNEHFTVHGPLRTSVKVGAGRVAVESADSGTAWASVQALDPGDEPSVQLASRASVRLQGDHLRVEVPDSGRRSRPAAVLITVGVPAGSTLELKGGAVDTSVRGGVAALTLKIGAGGVDVDEVREVMDVKAGQSDVRVGVAGSVCLAAGRGSLRADRVGGSTVTVGTGAVTLGRTDGAVLVKGGTVELSIDEAGPGEIGLQTGAGTAAIGVAAGTTVQLDLMSALGNVRCDLPLEPAAPAGGADLRLRLRTGRGDVRVATATRG